MVRLKDLLFYEVKGRVCENHQCPEFNQIKPKNSASLCEQCQSVTQEVKAFTWRKIIIPSVVLLAGFVLIAAFVYKHYQYDKTVQAFRDAIKSEELGKAEQILSDLRQRDNLKRCPDCQTTLDKTKTALPYREKFRLTHKVNPGQYAVPAHLKRFMSFINPPIVIEKPFYVQSHEVTVGEFRAYVDELDDNAKKRIGTSWSQSIDGKPYSDDKPAESLSWEEAERFTKWLQEKTLWNIALPSPQQWAASCVQFVKIASFQSDNEPKPAANVAEMSHLIENLREWTNESCQNGSYRIVGVNYMTDMTDQESVGKGECAKANDTWQGVGFRVVRFED
jgi:hypothetical protein